MAKVVLYKDLVSGDEVSIPVNVKVVAYEGNLQTFFGGLGKGETAEKAAEVLAEDGGARGIEVCYSHELASGETAMILETDTGIWWPSEKL